MKRIGLRVDDQIRTMNEEIANIEREYKLRLAKPNKQLANLKRHFKKVEVTINENIETDENKILEEKNEKVTQKKFNFQLKCLFSMID